MDELDGLAAWLAAGGARHDDLVMRVHAGGRGVFARRAIAPGTVVARVPHQLLMTDDRVERSAIGRAIRDAEVELSGSHAFHAAWLLVEQDNPRSRWQPYVAALPRDHRAFPIHAAPDEWALLDGTLAGMRLDELRTDLVLDHVALQSRVPRFGDFGRDALTWARLTVGSRRFSVTIDGVETSALVPLADMFDHRPDPGTRWTYDQDAEAFTITALRGFAPGDEVCISYGDKSNDRLLVQYGFCLDDNRHDEAELRVPAPFCVTRDPAHPEARQMLDWLHVQHAGGDIGAVLADAARDALAGLPPGDDDALLARADLSANARSFLRARRGEKEVLRAWLDIAAAFRA